MYGKPNGIATEHYHGAIPIKTIFFYNSKQKRVTSEIDYGGC